MAGCFTEAPVAKTAGDTDASSGPSTTEADTTTGADTGESNSGTATSATASESGDTGDGTDSGSGTTTGTDSGSDSSSDTGIPRPTVCPVFFDDFGDEVIDRRWRQSFVESSAEIDGELVITVTGELNDQYVTMVVLPEEMGLEGGSMRLEVGTPPADLGVRTALWVQPTMNTGRIAFNLAERNGGPRLEARITPEVGSPQVLATLDWNPDSMSWLQLRESEGVLYFETSADGGTFETFYQMETPFDVSSAEVGFAGHNDLALPSDVEVSVRTFEFICG